MEYNETFRATLSLAIPNHLFSITPSSAIVTIVDDDSKHSSYPPSLLPIPSPSPPHPQTPHLHDYYTIPTAANCGFNETFYDVYVTDRIVQIQISVTSGVLGRPVQLLFATRQESAIGMCTTPHHTTFAPELQLTHCTFF